MSDIRSTLDALLDEIGGESLKALITDALDAEKLKWGHCPNCKKMVKVDTPDIAARTKALTLLIDQAKGKPAETKKVTINTVGRSVRDMSTEELEAIVAGGEVTPESNGGSRLALMSNQDLESIVSQSEDEAA